MMHLVFDPFNLKCSLSLLKDSNGAGQNQVQAFAAAGGQSAVCSCAIPIADMWHAGWPIFNLNHLEDAHTRSWQAIQAFMAENMAMFAGKSSEAESTIMPSCGQWIRSMAADMVAPSIYLVLNCPTVGVMSAAQRSFFLNMASNVLSEWPQNTICFLIHPNKAGHKDASRLVPLFARGLKLTGPGVKL